MSTEAASVQTEALEQSTSNASRDFDDLFRAQYPRIARLIARVIRDSSRAEDVAVELFLKVWRTNGTRMENPVAWLHRAAVRKAIDELRRQARRSRYESLIRLTRKAPTPEELHIATEEQERVRAILTTITGRDAELLLLRSNELSYDEMATALDLNAASIGTLLSRAQDAFRKEYVRRYGKQ